MVITKRYAVGVLCYEAILRTKSAFTFLFNYLQYIYRYTILNIVYIYIYTIFSTRLYENKTIQFTAT